MSQRNYYDYDIPLKEFSKKIRNKFDEEMYRHSKNGRRDKDATLKAIDSILFTTDVYGDKEITELGDEFLQKLSHSMTTSYEEAYELWDNGLRMEINEKNYTLHIYDATGIRNGRLVDDKKEVYISLENKKKGTRTLDAATTLVDMIDYFDKRKEEFEYQTQTYKSNFGDQVDYFYVMDTRRIVYKPNLKDYSDKYTRKNAERLDQRTITRMNRAGENARKDTEYIYILKPELRERMEKAYGQYLAPKDSDEYWIQAQMYLDNRDDEEWGGSQETDIGEFFKWVNSDDFLDWTKTLGKNAREWKELTSREKAAALYQFYADIGKMELDNTTLEKILGRAEDIHINKRQSKQAKNVNDIIERLHSGEAALIYKNYTSPDVIEQIVERSYRDPTRQYKTEWKVSEKTARLYRGYTKEAYEERKKKK